jgi:hypothetical protein
VLVVAVAIVLGLLAATERASMNEAAATYPPPVSGCVFLPLVDRSGAPASAANDSSAEYAPAQIGPTAYPIPSLCRRTTGAHSIYLPAVLR